LAAARGNRDWESLTLYYVSGNTLYEDIWNFRRLGSPVLSPPLPTYFGCSPRLRLGNAPGRGISPVRLANTLLKNPSRSSVLSGTGAKKTRTQDQFKKT
jgi:hypothetical protein